MVLCGFIRHVRVHSLFLNDFPSCSFFHEQIHEKSIFRADQIHGKLASQAAEAERLARLWRELRPQALLGAGAAEVVAFSKEQRLGDVCRGLLGS